METMQPTLLIGSADWVSERLPREEYLRRLEQLWADYPEAGGAIIYGSPRDHAALAYLTHFTPKLEPAIALIPKNGRPRLLVGGGATMIGAARPLTFVEDLAPLRDVHAIATEWARGLQAGAGVVLLNVEAMTSSLHQALHAALNGRLLIDGDPQLAARMRVKSARELDIMRAGCALLAHGVGALRQAFQRGEGATNCVLEAEHVLLGSGAQDVRTLFSSDRGRTLRPFEATVPTWIDPLPVYLAVRHGGYWAEGFCSLHLGADELAEHADDMIAALLPEMLPAGCLSSLAERAGALRGAFALHPMTGGAVARPIGLSLESAPLTSASRHLMRPGETYALQVGLVDADHSAFASAMVAITESGYELLWSSRC